MPLDGVREAIEDQLRQLVLDDLDVTDAAAVESLANALRALPAPIPAPAIDRDRLRVVAWQAATNHGASVAVADAVAEAVKDLEL